MIYYHGYGSYVGKYGYIGHDFAERGYDFVGFDHRGFGNTEGDRGFVSSFEQHMEDSRRFAEVVQAEYSGLPCLALGYSMGGATTLCLELEGHIKFDGMILTCPLVEQPLFMTPSRTLRSIAQVWPRKVVID